MTTSTARIFLPSGTYEGDFPGTVPLFEASLSPSTVEVGGVVTLTVNGPVVSREWRRNGVAISGATGTTYTTVSADEDTLLTCYVVPLGAQEPVEAGPVTVEEAAVAGSAYTFLATGENTGTTADQLLTTLTAVDYDRKIVVQASFWWQSTATFDAAAEWQLQLGAITGTTHYTSDSRTRGAFVYVISVPANTSGELRLVRTSAESNRNMRRPSWQIGEIPNSYTLETAVVVLDRALNTGANVSQSVAEGAGVIVGAVHSGDVAERVVTWSSPVESVFYLRSGDGVNGATHSHGYIPTVSAGTQTLTTAVSGEATNQVDLTYSIEIVPGA
jgi:hypothetical protein